VVSKLRCEGKKSSRVVSKAKCRETTTTPSSRDCHNYHTLSDLSERAFSLSERLSSEN